MGLDTPRRTDIPAGGETTARAAPVDHQREARNRLLALSADLSDIGVRTRMVSPPRTRPSDYPVTLRAWTPSQMGRAREVICIPDGYDPPRTWEFQYLIPVGVTIADATEALNPGQAVEAAGRVKAGLESKPR